MKTCGNVLWKAICCIGLIAYMTLTAWANDIPEATEAFYVNDYADLLDQACEDHIVAVNQTLYNDYEVQLVVVTVKELNGQDIESYTYDLFNSWQIGTKSTNRGLLLVLAEREDDYYIMPGKGLKKKLPADDLSDLLYEQLETDFANKTYSAGVTKTVDALADSVKARVSKVIPKDESAANKPKEEVKEQEELSPIQYLISFGVIVGGGWAFVNYRKKHPRKPREPKAPKVKRQRASRQQNVYADYYFTDPRYYDDPRYYRDPLFYNDPRYHMHRHLYHHDHYHHHERDHRENQRPVKHHSSSGSFGSSASRPSAPSSAPKHGMGGSTDGGGAGRRKR